MVWSTVKHFHCLVVSAATGGVCGVCFSVTHGGAYDVVKNFSSEGFV